MRRLDEGMEKLIRRTKAAGFTPPSFNPSLSGDHATGHYVMPSPDQGGPPEKHPLRSAFTSATYRREGRIKINTPAREAETERRNLPPTLKAMGGFHTPAAPEVEREAQITPRGQKTTGIEAAERDSARLAAQKVKTRTEKLSRTQFKKAKQASSRTAATLNLLRQAGPEGARSAGAELINRLRGGANTVESTDLSQTDVLPPRDVAPLSGTAKTLQQTAMLAPGTTSSGVRKKGPPAAKQKLTPSERSRIATSEIRQVAKAQKIPLHLQVDPKTGRSTISTRRHRNLDLIHTIESLDRSPLLYEFVGTGAIAVGPSPHVRPDLIGKRISGAPSSKSATDTGNVGLRSSPSGFANYGNIRKKRKGRKKRKK